MVSAAPWLIQSLQAIHENANVALPKYSPEIYDLNSGVYIPTVPTAPSVIEVLNYNNILPDKLGIATDSANEKLQALSTIKSIFDPAFKTYLENMPRGYADQFLSGFTNVKLELPEYNVDAGNSGGLFGIIKNVFGTGLGVVADGFNALDVFSRYTEQSLGVTASYIEDILGNGFGSDLSLDERWRAGRLAYEGIGNDVWERALYLGATDDAAFEEFIRKHEGGAVDLGIRMLADPLNLLGGIPLIAGGTKLIGGAKGIQGTVVARSIIKGGEAIGRGFQVADVPLLGAGLRAAVESEGVVGAVSRVLVKPLLIIGSPIEARITERVANQVGVHSSVAADLLRHTELGDAVKAVSDPGWIKSLRELQPDRLADRVANETYSLMQALTRVTDDRVVLRNTIYSWQQSGDHLPNVIKSGALGDIFGIVRRMDLDKFQSLKLNFNGDWKSKFLQEVLTGPGKVSNNPVNGLNKLAEAHYAVKSTPLGKFARFNKWALGGALLNNPGYVFLNIINNTFTVAFDAINTFDADPYGAIRVFTRTHNDLMTKKFGDNWKELRHTAGAGNDWMGREFGFARGTDGGAQHIWDNVAVNFGVRVASWFDNAARNTAAEFAMLRSDHYLNRFGQVFPGMPDDVRQVLGSAVDSLQPDELIGLMDSIRAGDAFGTLSMRSMRSQYFDGVATKLGITDARGKLALRETLEVHLGGHLNKLEDDIVEALALGSNGSRQAIVDIVNQSRAEMQMLYQQSARISKLGPSTPGVVYKSYHDVVPMDWAQMDDEFTYFSTQAGLMMKSSTAFNTKIGAAQRSNIMTRLTNEYKKYNQLRSDILTDYTRAISNRKFNDAKEAVDNLEFLSSKYRLAMKGHFDNIVNTVAKSDISQARAFNGMTGRWLDSLNLPEQAFRRQLRGAYWPRHVTDNAEIDNIVSNAMYFRSNEVREIFAENVADFKVGAWAPPPVMSDMPMMSDRFNIYNQEWSKYMDYMENNIDDIYKRADDFRREVDVQKLEDFAKTTSASKVDYEYARNYWVRQMTDFSMLDYGHQFGFEKYVQFMFPYEFWPTRTAWHWAERAASRPGAAANLWKVKEAQDDWQEDVNRKYIEEIKAQLEPQLNDPDLSPEVKADLQRQFDERMALASRMNKLTIPVPGLGSLLKKVGLSDVFRPEIAFDPYSAIFPVANWDKDYREFNEVDNPFGKMYRWASGMKISPNPIVKGAMQLTGILPEREEAFDWLRNAGSPAATALGFGGAGQAVYRWMSLGDDSLMNKLGEEIGVDLQGFFFENGYGAPGLLKKLAAEITGTDEQDVKSFELYATSRTLASMAASDNRLSNLEKDRVRRKAAGEDASEVDDDINFKREQVAMEYVKAYHDRSGGLWDKAMRQSADELGLRDLTKWLFGMGGINVWQPGENIQNGLEFLQDALSRHGTNDELKAFYNQYPEFTMRRIQDLTLRDKEETQNIARQSLYFHESELINKEFEPRIDKIDKIIDGLNEKIKGIESQGLQLRANRSARSALFDEIGVYIEQRNALYDERNERYDGLVALYGKPRNSYSKDPMERALDNYKDEWYQTYRIKDRDERDAAQEAFLNRFEPSNQFSPNWMQFAIQAEVVRQKAYEDTVGKTNEAARKIVEARNKEIERLTFESQAYISRRDIEAAIGRVVQGPPSSAVAEYRQAVGLFQSYMAIEGLGLEEAEQRRRKKEFWDSNPLLEKYYGLESYLGSPQYAIQSTLKDWYEFWEGVPEDQKARSEYLRANSKKIDQLRAVLEPEGLIKPEDPNSKRLGDIWDGYYQLPEGQARRDYVAANKSEIDRLNNILGRQPSQSTVDISRESQIWEYYFSLPKGDSREAYLYIVLDELNEIRARLGKEPFVMGLRKSNPRLSDSAPLKLEDLVK